MKTKLLSTIALAAVLFCANSVSAQVSYRTSDDAQAAAQSALNRVRENERCVARVVERNNENNEQQVALARKIGDLIEEKKVALEEFREGWFCSKCKRSKSEIEKAEGISFEDHLKKVNGEPVPATEEQINEKSAEFNQKISGLEGQRANLKQRYEELTNEGIGCYTEQERARYDYVLATVWSEVLASGKYKDFKVTSPVTLDASRFGLGENVITSPYNVVRVELIGEKIRTWKDGELIDLDKVTRIEFHPGIDFSSRKPGDRDPSPLPFRAGFNGTIVLYPRSTTNTIGLVLDNGNTVQFLHSSQILVKAGQRVSADDTLGVTGRIGADAIHLHVQARDKYGNIMDPTIAPYGVNDLYAHVYKEAFRRVEETPTAIPQLGWTETPYSSSSASDNSATDNGEERRAAERSRAFEEQNRRNGNRPNNPPPAEPVIVRKPGESDDDFRARQRAAEFEKQNRSRPPLP